VSPIRVGARQICECLFEQRNGPTDVACIAEPVKRLRRELPTLTFLGDISRPSFSSATPLLMSARLPSRIKRCENALPRSARYSTTPGSSRTASPYAPKDVLSPAESVSKKACESATAHVWMVHRLGGGDEK
jgi:hypothetical protein